MSIFELSAVLITLTAVVLTAREVIWCWPIGLVSVSMYAWILFEAKLYADMGLQVFYFLLSLYGWWAWLRGGEDHSTLEVSCSPWKFRILGGLGALVLALTLGTLLSRGTDASFPFLDSTLTSFSLLAQFFATRKWIENWLIWIAVDVFYIGMFIFKDLYLTSGLYAVFLVVAAMGWVEWRGSMSEAPSGPVNG